ncbi:MAG: hypothetical protein ACXV5Q_10435 [Frankiaceae bacterium]
MTFYHTAREAVLAALLAQVSEGLSGAALLALAQAWARLTGAGPGNSPPLTETEAALAERVRERLLETVTTVSAGLAKFPTSPVARSANETHAAELRDLAGCVTLLHPPARSSD